MQAGGEIAKIAEPQAEAKPNRLSDGMWEALEGMRGRDKVDDDRRLRQLAVLENLPQDFDLNLQGYVHYGFNRLFLLPQEANSWIDGALFEELVKADVEICPTPESAAGQQIRAVMHDPGRFSFEGDGGIFHQVRQQPDLVDISGDGLLTRAVEIKKKIDNRAVTQMNEFMPQFKKAIDLFKNIKADILRAHGLGAIADKKLVLGVAKDFKKVIVVPFGAYDGVHKDQLLDPEMTEKEKQEGRSALGRCEVQMAAFNHEEVAAIRNFLRARLKI